jgi:4-amino-4-deoxy-L-arabinose transferase-like glycosyltransferase
MNIQTRERVLLFFISVLLFIPGLGGVHLFDWDEINFAEISREMILTGNYLQPQINFEPFWEKPPLFIWIQIVSMKLFGINEFAARLPNAICGILTLQLLYTAIYRHIGRPYAFITALLYAGSILPHLYFRSGIIDPWFNLFIALSAYESWRYFKDSGQRKILRFILASIYLGLAVLTKGPASIVILTPLLLFFVVTSYHSLLQTIKEIVIFLIFAMVVSGSWYFVDSIKNGTWFTEQFITYQIRLLQTKDAGHGGFFGYHFVVLLFGCLPMSAFIFPVIFNKRSSGSQSLRLPSIILLTTVLIVFSLVKTKIVHYSSAAYLPMCVLSGYGIKQIIEERKFNNMILILLSFQWVIWASAIVAVPYIFHNQVSLSKYFNDPFAQESLMSGESWPKVTWIPAISIFFVSILLLKFRNSLKRFVFVLSLGNSLVISLTLIFFIGRIETFSQSGMIELLESVPKGESVQTYGFKSYAQYFYGKSTKTTPTFDELKNSRTKCYLICKKGKESDLSKMPEFEYVNQSGGFFLYRTRRESPEFN